MIRIRFTLNQVLAMEQLQLQSYLGPHADRPMLLLDSDCYEILKRVSRAEGQKFRSVQCKVASALEAERRKRKA